MPSDARLAGAAQQGAPWTWLWSQGLGILCGQATVLLLAVGSVVLAITREGASARIAMDDFRAFFEPPSPVHTWFYLLVPVLALYALNTLLATWRNAVRKWRNGLPSPHSYAAVAIHASFLVGLIAHGVGGLFGAEGGGLFLGPTWQELGDGRRARVKALDLGTQPDGSLEQVWATLELRGPDGALSESVVSYNGPLSTGLGSDLLLLVRPGSVPAAARLARGSARCRAELEGSCELGGLEVRLLYMHPPGRPGMGSLARVDLRGAPVAGSKELWLMEGRPVRLADGSVLALEGVEERPGIQLRRRHAPGNPWALAASILLVLGLGMMWRRFLWAGREEPGNPG